MITALSVQHQALPAVADVNLLHPIVASQAHKKGEDLFHEINDNTSDGWLDFEDKIYTAFEPINKPFEGIEDSIEKGLDTLAEDIYPDAEDDFENDPSWIVYFGYFRWIFNWIFFATPWFFFSIFMCIFNLLFNILLNDWWADGNFLLIYNSFYLIM